MLDSNKPPCKIFMKQIPPPRISPQGVFESSHLYPYLAVLAVISNLGTFNYNTALFLTYLTGNLSNWVYRHKPHWTKTPGT